MRLLDVNVLVNAHRLEAPQHGDYRGLVDSMLNGDEPYGVSDFVVNGFVRVVTNHRVYRDPTPLDVALLYAGLVRNQPHATVVGPGPSFWRIFTELCDQAAAKGKLVPDAYLAAVAIEHGCEFISADRDFGRFPGLRWRHPLD